MLRILVIGLFWLTTGIGTARADSIIVDGAERNYLQFSAPKPSAIIIAYHGTLGTARSMARLTGLHLRGVPAIVIYPQGNMWTWDVSARSKDVRFTQALIDRARSIYGNLPVDVTGISAGGSMAWRAAQELDIDHAVSVAGDCTNPERLVFSRTRKHAPDLLQLHGDADHIAPLAGGTAPFGARLPPVRSCINAFNAAGGTATLRVIPGGKHAWDLGVGYSTTDEILRFFGLSPK